MNKLSVLIIKDTSRVYI